MTDPSIRLRNAIKEDNYFIVSRLLKRFPDLLDNIDPANGWSNLHYAAYHNNYQISELLLQNIHARFLTVIPEAADTNFLSRLKDPNSSVYNQINDEDEIKLNFDKQTVLHVACIGDAAATLNLLLSYFNVCLDQRDINGFTPSHICCVKGFSNCLSILLENGAYPNLQDNDGDTPLHKAFQYSNIKCLEILIKYNADDELYNNVGWKPSDVAFNTDILQEYKSLKANISNIITTHPISIPEMPQTKYASVKIPQNSANSVSFLSSSSLSNHQTRINLPSIQPRKYSLSSMLSDEYIDRFDPYEDQRSIGTTPSSKNSRNSSPMCSTSNVSFTSKKSPTTGLQESNMPMTSKRYPPPLSIQSSYNGTSHVMTSPRRATISNYSVNNESPASKRSSLSTRTFRSNSQLSDVSMVKEENSPLIQQSSELSSIKPSIPTPRHSLQGIYRTTTSYTLPSQVEEASSKLHDLKLKNVDRLKLDTKLGNIINNTSQENLVSPTNIIFSGATSNVERNEVKNNSIDNGKRSKILSIPILSSRIRHNT